MNILEKLLIIFPHKSWNFNCLSLNPNISEKFIENNIKSPWNWYYLSKILYFTEDFIKKYSDKFTWQTLFRNKSLTLNLIDDYLQKNELSDKLSDNTRYLSQNPNLFTPNPKDTEKFIIKYIDKLDLNQIFQHSSFTLDHLEYFLKNGIINKIDYFYLSRNPNLTIDFIEKNITKNWDWQNLSYSSVLTVEFIKKFR